MTREETEKHYSKQRQQHHRDADGQANPYRRGENPHRLNNKQQDYSLLQGILDYSNFPISDYDYYGQLASLGFFNPDAIPIGGPWTHDIPLTSTLHYHDTAKKKTPIDARLDVITQNLGRLAAAYKDADLYAVQNFEETNTERIKEKTHRILSDPTRKYQSQVMIDIQNMKAKLYKERKSIPPFNQLIEYNMMLLNVNSLMLERLTDVLDYQEKMLSYSKYESRPLGHNFYAEMTLVSNAPPTKIDFRDETNNANLPSGAILLDYPKHNLISLQINFDAGATVQFATNKPANSLETTIKMIAAPDKFTMATPDKFSIESLNIRATGGNATVRLIGLY